MECYGVSAADEASVINNPTSLQSSASRYTPVKPMPHAIVYNARWILPITLHRAVFARFSLILAQKT